MSGNTPADMLVAPAHYCGHRQHSMPRPHGPGIHIHAGAHEKPCAHLALSFSAFCLAACCACLNAAMALRSPRSPVYACKGGGGWGVGEADGRWMVVMAGHADVHAVCGVCVVGSCKQAMVMMVPDGRIIRHADSSYVPTHTCCTAALQHCSTQASRQAGKQASRQAGKQAG